MQQHHDIGSQNKKANITIYFISNHPDEFDIHYLLIFFTTTEIFKIKICKNHKLLFPIFRLLKH